MKNYFTAFMMAWGNFLSIPCPKKIWDKELKKEMLSVLPFIGLIVGIIEFLLCYVFFRLHLPVSLSAFFLTLVAFGISGFMHADGFMDVCDAVLSRRDQKERQRILKDSRVGAFAVISMILMAIGTFAAFFAIAEHELSHMAISYTVSANLLPITSILSLIAIPVASRTMSGACVLKLKPLESSQYSKEDRGDSARYVKFMMAVLIAILLVLVIISVILSAFIGKETIIGYLLLLIASVIATLAATRLFVELAQRNLGGMNGDIAGFSICMGELIGLIVLAIALFR